MESILSWEENVHSYFILHKGHYENRDRNSKLKVTLKKRFGMEYCKKKKIEAELGHHSNVSLKTLFVFM